MNLQEFTQKTIDDVVAGIQSAQQSPRDGRLFTNKISIDVAVIVEEKDGKKGEADLKVLGILTADGEISKESSNSSISRVKFEVNISNAVFDRESAHVYHPPTKTFDRGR